MALDDAAFEPPVPAPTDASVDGAIRAERRLIRDRMRSLDLVGALILALIVPLLLAQWTGQLIATTWGVSFALISVMGANLDGPRERLWHKVWILGLGSLWAAVPLLVWSSFDIAGTAVAVLTLIVLAVHALNLSLSAASLWFVPSIAMSTSTVLASLFHGGWGQAVLVLVFALFVLSGGRTSDTVFRTQVRSRLMERFHRDRYEHEAMHDALTGLPNRRFAAKWLEAHNGQVVTVAAIDFDDFKRINETWDHMVGDDALVAASQGLVATLPGWTITRSGGDEFAAYIAGEVAIESIGPFPVTSRHQGQPVEFVVALSCGTTSGDPARRNLQSEAEFTLGHAKQEKGRVVPMTADTRAVFETRQRLAIEASDALAQDQIVAWGQPVVCARSGDVLGVELLARWHHPDLGLLLPEDFLPAVAAAGRERQLFDHMLELAVAHLAQLDAGECSSDADLGWGGWISVNIEPTVFGQYGLPDHVIEALGRADIAPGRLMLEIIETSALADQRHIIDNLQRLTDAGVRVAIDDFGTGHFSFRDLSTLPTDYKLDGLIAASDRSAEFAQAIVAIAEPNGAFVIAEGVETQAMAARMTRAGVTALQGHWLAVPMPLADVSLEAFRGVSAAST